ncbi:MAG: hypothetical protein JNL11_11760 [Bdellovibrionaceae bacterium]|nr:hypothetical protein [Pseudobdellovibrionaceae bacterium]
MGIKDQMAAMAQGAQTRAKSSAYMFMQISFRLVTGFFLGLTISLIGQELTGYGSFSLVFLNLVVMGLFFKLSQNWNMVKILVFDLVCLLVIQILKMYILVAP